MAVLVAYRSSDGRLLWWATDADPKAFKARPGEVIVEMPADEYRKVHPQAFVSRETGLIPDNAQEAAARKAERAPKASERLPSRREPYTS